VKNDESMDFDPLGHDVEFLVAIQVPQ
jgi:hypothetical protein